MNTIQTLEKIALLFDDAGNDGFVQFKENFKFATICLILHYFQVCDMTTEEVVDTIKQYIYKDLMTLSINHPTYLLFPISKEGSTLRANWCRDLIKKLLNKDIT